MHDLGHRVIALEERPVGVGFGCHRPDVHAALGDRVEHAERAADEETATEHLPQVAHLVELVPDEARAHRVVVRRERSGGHGRFVGRLRHRRERGFGRQPTGLDGVVHALEGRDVHHSDPVATEEQAGGVEPARQCVEPTARDRLRPPLNALAAFEDGTHRRVGLQDLEQVVGVETSVAVVETEDHADRDQVVAHRVDERSAELAVLRLRAQRPPHRVDHPVERPRDLPHFLHAELPHLRRGIAAQPEVIERDAGDVPIRALREHGHPGNEVTARLEVGQLLVLQARPLSPVRTPTTPPPSTRRSTAEVSGRNIAPSASARSASQRPSCERETTTLPWLRIGGGVGIGRPAVAGQDVHLLVVDLAVGGHAVEAAVTVEETLQRAGADHRAGQEVRPGLLAFLDDRERDVAESLGDLLVLLEQLPEADRAGEAGGSGAHHEHAHLDALVERVARRDDELVAVERGGEIGGTRHRPRVCGAARRGRGRRCARRPRPRGR